MASTLTAQPSAPTTAAGRSLAWAQTNRKLLLIIGGVLVVVLLGAWFMTTASSRREEFANRSLTQARNLLDAQNYALASTELQKIIDTYGGTPAAQEAEISMGQLQLISGQNELAVVRMREFVGRNPEPRYAAAGYGLLGAALENVNRSQEAAEAYKRASELALVDYLKAEYLLQAGRAYVGAGKVDEAQAIYRTIVDQYASTGALTEAKVRLAELTKGTL
jgi:TolA-binding protein